MPTYEYICDSCNHKMEVFHPMTDAPRRWYPECKKNSLRRIIGSGGGIIFRGEPFSYSTEYLKKNRKKKR